VLRYPAKKKMLYATTTCNFTSPKQIQSGNVVNVIGSNSNFQFASSTCVTIYEESATSSASSSPSVTIVNGFTYGEIWIGTLLLLLLLGQFFGGIITHTVGLKRRERNTRNPQ